MPRALFGEHGYYKATNPATGAHVAVLTLLNSTWKYTCGVLVALVQRSRTEVRAAGAAAVAARDFANPMGNGYTKDSLDALQRIENSQAEMRMDIGGIRSELREDRRANVAAFGELRQADRDLHQRITDVHPRGDGS